MSEPDNVLNHLAQRALKQIRALAKGNGAEKDSIQIKSFDGEMIEMEALNHLEIHPEVHHDQKPGRYEVGEFVESREQIDKAIDKIVKGAMSSKESRRTLSRTLLEREDKGFGLHAEYFEVEPLNRTYSYYEPCGTCGGHGQVTCGRCGGHRQEVCSKCHGRAMVPCNYCNGSGYMTGPDGKQIQCNRCHGHRQTPCPVCRKTGTISCRQCNAQGVVKCTSCNGAAVNTHIVQMVAKLKTLFEMDRAAIPHEATKVIEDKGAKMVAKGQIKLSAEQVRREDGGLAIQYVARFPFGKMQVAVNGKPLKLCVFGFKGKIVKLPDFLDQLVEANMRLLHEAAAGHGNASSKVRKAGRSRLIADGLLYALSLPPKKAMIALKKKYPMGASNDLLKDVILSSGKALANVTRKTRFGGVALGAVCAALVDAAYFIGPLRGIVMGSIGPQVTMGLDFMLIPLGGVIGTLASAMMAKRPLKQALGPLMPDTMKGRFKPKKQGSAWLNYLASTAVFVAVIFAAKYMPGNVPPAWFPF